MHAGRIQQECEAELVRTGHKGIHLRKIWNVCLSRPNHQFLCNRPPRETRTVVRLMCFELVEAVAKPGCKRVHSSSCHGDGFCATHVCMVEKRIH